MPAATAVKRVPSIPVAMHNDYHRITPLHLTNLLRRALVRQVRDAFNDIEAGERPVVPSDNALFERDSPIRMVHADVVAMMVGGMSALMLQMLHPHALQGILDHSNFRADMHGRLRRTARFIAVTTFGDREAARNAINRVNEIHSSVSGTLDDGTPYSATDPKVLGWVHVAEAICFLEAYLRYVDPAMPRADQDRYFSQFAVVARRLHADPVPTTKSDAMRMLGEYRPDLRGTENARNIAHLIVHARPAGMLGVIQPVLANAAIDLLPPFARTMLGLQRGPMTFLPANAVTYGLSGAVRWAFSQGRHTKR